MTARNEAIKRLFSKENTQTMIAIAFGIAVGTIVHYLVTGHGLETPSWLVSSADFGGYLPHMRGAA